MITDIDANGRVQLPLAIRCLLNLCPGDKIVVDQLGDGTIILKKILEDIYQSDTEQSNAETELVERSETSRSFDSNIKSKGKGSCSGNTSVCRARTTS